MGKISTSTRKPGPQNPGKYQSTGPNYAKWGEQPGYVYLPQTDQYYINPKDVQQTLEDQGAVDKTKQPPGLAETVGATAATVGAIYGGKQLAERGGEALGGLFGAGADKPVAGLAIGPGTKAGIGPVASGEQYGLALQSNPIEGQGMIGAGAEGGAGVGGGGAGGEFVGPVQPAQSAGTPWAAFGQPSYAGYAGAAYEGYKGAKELYSGRDNDKFSRLGMASGRAIGDIWTAGGVSALDAVMRKRFPGLMAQHDKWAAKLDPVNIIANRFLNTDEWKTEGNRLNAAAKKGAYVPQDLIDFANSLKQGRSKKELVARAAANNGNTKFAESRNEADLTPIDILGYATFVEHDPNWFNRPEQERMDYAAKVLEAGAVREHHGTIDVDWNKAPPLPGTSPGQSTTQQSQSRSQTRSPGIDKNGNRIDYKQGLIGAGR